jgi:hypothetical protein
MGLEQAADVERTSERMNCQTSDAGRGGLSLKFLSAFWS